jgi:hypothetical protein
MASCLINRYPQSRKSIETNGTGRKVSAHRDKDSDTRLEPMRHIAGGDIDRQVQRLVGKYFLEKEPDCKLWWLVNLTLRRTNTSLGFIRFLLACVSAVTARRAVLHFPCYAFLRCFEIVISATPAMIIAEAMKSLGLTVSFSMSQPRKTATIGFT